MLPKNEKVRNVIEVRAARKEYERLCTNSQYIESQLYRNIKEKEYYLGMTSRNIETIRNRIDRIERHIEILICQHDEASTECIDARINWLSEQKIAMRNAGIET